MGTLNHRRDFLRAGLLAAGALPFGLGAMSSPAPRLERTFTLVGNRVRLTCPRVERAFTVMVAADTHLFRDDARGEPYRQFSGRMAKAYHHTRHFQTGEPTNPEAGFLGLLAAARAAKAAHLALVGDIVSFPSESAVEWALARLGESGVPWLYTSGNHDWHYEGMEGSLDQLRLEWISRRLAPLYRGAEPLMHATDLHGVRLLALDNSTYEVSPAQLAYFRRQVASGVPLILLLHIPLYAPGRPLGFGCGHPEWGAHSDRAHQLERRPRWREGGHTEVTLAFHREVFAAGNLLGVFAGHTHQASLDVVNGVHQCVVEPNAAGGFLQLDVVPG